jgi:hypothetical protein
MSGGSISGNTAGSDGGGVFLYGFCNFNMSGGIISGNVAGSGVGGGVAVTSAGGSFNKTGGTIHGKDATGNDAAGLPLKNTASGDTQGHAVYHNGGAAGSKYRDNTAGPAIDMSTSPSVGWEN